MNSGHIGPLKGQKRLIMNYTIYYTESCGPCSVINTRNTKECGTFRAVQNILQGPYTVKKNMDKLDRIGCQVIYEDWNLSPQSADSPPPPFL